MASQPVVLCQSQSCLNGNPPSKLECPTCSKLKIKGSFFCTQECFKAEWKTHKFIHDMLKAKAADVSGSNVAKPGVEGTYNPFPDFSFTGPLRPIYPLTPRRKVPDHIPRPDYAEDGKPKSEGKDWEKPPQCLGPEDQERMRVVSRMGREILDLAASHLRPGISTEEIDEIVHNATIEKNAYPSTLNYHHYPKSLCTSVNEVVCHGIPDHRILQEGDIINLDISLYFNGVHGDLNATYPVGNIDEDSKKLINTCREALDAAIRLCKPGALFRDVGKTIEPICKANGCSVIRSYVGHGIGTSFHPPPNIPHYAKNKAIGTMKPGMVFTIEPMVNLGPNWGEIHWPDNWTATTTDGKRSAQFEETVLITETGVEVLTAGKDFVL